MNINDPNRSALSFVMTRDWTTADAAVPDGPFPGNHPSLHPLPGDPPPPLLPPALCQVHSGSSISGRGRLAGVAVLLAVLCGPAPNLSALYYADLTVLIQRSKLLGPQPPAEMIYPCPPPSHIPHSDSLAVCFAHPSGPTEEDGARREDAWPPWRRGTALSCSGGDSVPEEIYRGNKRCVGYPGEGGRIL